jgi:hypothetical protein
VPSSVRDVHVKVMESFVDEFVAPQDICPYTSSSGSAATGRLLRARGIPAAPVLYPVSSAVDPLAMSADCFEAAVDLLTRPDCEPSTALLAGPWFGEGDFANVFAPFSALLVNYLMVSGAMKQVGMCCQRDEGHVSVPKTRWLSLIAPFLVTQASSCSTPTTTAPSRRCRRMHLRRAICPQMLTCDRSLRGSKAATGRTA